jgi:CRISPR-associated protein Csb2
MKNRTTGHGKNMQTIEERATIYDPAWYLCMETLQLHKDRWSDPPGSRWVRYTRPRDCFKIEPSVMPSRRAADKPIVRLARFALDSTVLPLVTETLPVAEATRRAVMSIHGRLTERNGVRGRSAVFSGKDEQGAPLACHRHAYYLPTDEDGDGRLDHLTVSATAGFGPDEQRAFDRLRELRTGREGEDRHPLRLLLLGLGVSEEYHPGPLRFSATWESATPYIATRYAKTSGRHRIDMGSSESRAEFLRKDLLAQLATVRPDLASEGVPEVTVEPLWEDNCVFKIAGCWRTIQFKRFRHKAGDDGGRRLAGAFRLTFRCPVAGPIALGWSSHFGMGLFVPAAERKPC